MCLDDLDRMKEKIKQGDYNIMLIGFMGLGKTTVAKCLSQMLSIECIEMDDLIVEKEGMRINRIFEEYGEEYFRNCESDTLIDLQKRKQLIISCGGGAVLRDENVQNMKKNGRVVLLTATPETIFKRVKDSTERPIIANNMNVGFIKELMEKRRKKYLDAADIIVNTDDKSVQAVCKEIICKLAKMDQ
ncbi:MAG: shikimate kinase [Clostridiaceae bacterium]